MKKYISFIIFLGILILSSPFVYCQEHVIYSDYYIKDGHKLIENYFNINYKDKTTISVFVNQPIPGTRYVAGYDDIFFTGHSFIRLQYYEPDQNGHMIKKVIYRGFYPISQLTLQQITDRSNVNAFMGTEQASPPEWDHVWQIAKVYIITPEGAKNALNYIDSIIKSNISFHAQKNNCATFAVNVLKEAGATSNFYPHKMQLTIAHKIFLWKNNYSIEDIYTYTAADLGEDIRLTSHYLTPGEKGIQENSTIFVPLRKTIDYKYFIKEKLALSYKEKYKLIRYMRENSLELKSGRYYINDNMTFEDILKTLEFVEYKK